MNAIKYKIKQLLKCKQSYYHNCMSSNGIFSLYKIPRTRDYKCDPIYDITQRSLCEKSENPVIKSITSWNIQELFWHCYARDKLVNILSYIIHSTSDVICLQEAFEISTLDAIVYNNEIKNKYPYFLSGSLANRYIVGENSGLLILSKYPIVFEKFTPFHKASFPDSFASKGALYFSTGGINFIVTHLQSENNTIACLQLNKLLSNSQFKKNTFLIGDLNIQFPQAFTNTNINNTTITHKDSNRILDHIINITHDINFTLNVDCFDITRYSDHYPLIAKIN